MSNSEMTTELVIVDYADLIESSTSEGLLKSVEEAFGSDGIGLIGVRNVPDFENAKSSVLSQAHPLAHLPANELQELEDPDSLYNAGWSHGKEMLKAGTPDTAKGSFYFNPLVDNPNPQEREKYPVSYPVNRWPKKESLPELEPSSKRMGSMMKDVAVHVSRHIDAYVQTKNKNYPSNVIYNALVDTEKVKGRLLYYFPLPEASKSEDSWIGWHNDSGFLTALAGDLYMDTNGNPVTPPSSSPAGLHVVTRNGQVCKVVIPSDCMAIQIGECTQILTGGTIVATPHCVRGAPNFARASLACFIDVPPATPLVIPQGSTMESVMALESQKVPTMAHRWTNGMTFGDFLQKTFEAYYNQT